MCGGAASPPFHLAQHAPLGSPGEGWGAGSPRAALGRRGAAQTSVERRVPGEPRAAPAATSRLPFPLASQAGAPHPSQPRGPGHPPAAAPALARGRGAMQKKGGDSPPLPPAGVQGPPLGLRLAGQGVPRGPCSLRLDWSPASNPSARGGGQTSRKKIPPLPRRDLSDGAGGGRRKSFSAESTEPTGLHPASAVRGRHKAAPPAPPPGPAPPPPLPPRPVAGPGVGRSGEAAGRLLPGRPGREGERLEPREPARLPGVGAGAGARGCLPRNPRQI